MAVLCLCWKKRSRFTYYFYIRSFPIFVRWACDKDNGWKTKKKCVLIMESLGTSATSKYPKISRPSSWISLLFIVMRWTDFEWTGMKVMRSMSWMEFVFMTSTVNKAAWWYSCANKTIKLFWIFYKASFCVTAQFGVHGKKVTCTDQELSHSRKVKKKNYNQLAAKGNHKHFSNNKMHKCFLYIHRHAS